MNYQHSTLITYATNNFKKQSISLGISAVRNGFDTFKRFDLGNIDLTFFNRNSETFKLSRGGGYWLWKPYIIASTLNESKESEVVCYVDSGVRLLAIGDILIDLVKDDKIHVWKESDGIIEQWTEPSVLEKLDIRGNDAKLPIIWAGAIISRNTDAFKWIANEWLELSQNPELLRPESLEGYLKSGEFIWHRHDQSLLSILVCKYPNYFTVHSKELSPDMYSIFDRHRNFNIRTFLLTLSFPRMRRLRSNLINLLPHFLRSFLREKRTFAQNKNLTDQELNSIKKIY